MTDHIIDLDGDPRLDQDYTLRFWQVIEHRKGGQFEWDPTKIELWRCAAWELQAAEGYKWEQRKSFNTNMLDYLLAYPELIPEPWKAEDVCFAGTIYCPGRHYQRVIRCLRWKHNCPGWAQYRIDEYFEDDDITTFHEDRMTMAVPAL